MLGLVLVALAPLPALAQRASTADNHIAYLHSILRRNPRDARALHRLGDAYIRKARETGDVAYFQRAERAIRQSLELTPDNAGASRHLAYVLYSLHDFDGAAAEARRALALDETDRHAYGVLGDALLEVGKYTEGELAYRRMMELGTDAYGYARRAGLKSVHGDPDGAIADLERAVADGRATGLPAESLAWMLWQLGAEHAALGRLDRADVAFTNALATYPGYHRALAGLAHVQAARSRFDEAVVLYLKALAVIPQPEYAAALGDVLVASGRPSEARKHYDLVEYIGRLDAVNQVLYNRELAYFYADHDVKLDTALELARRELTVRQDIYAYDLLAWTLTKNGRHAEAQAAMTSALRLGTRDARLHYHAGMIAHARGDVDQARTHLARALALNPQFHVRHARVAADTLASLKGTATSASGPGSRAARPRTDSRPGS
jgi:tetratricopeptide (TPR) repeat protein